MKTGSIVTDEKGVTISSYSTTTSSEMKKNEKVSKFDDKDWIERSDED